MNEEVRLSIILCVYNGEKYLPEAIDTLLRDRRPGTEILCLDDGSSDASLSILRSREPALTIYGEPHRGISAARNLAVQRSRGGYIAFHDADDLWVPGRSSRQTAYLDAHPECDMVFGHMHIFSGDEHGGFPDGAGARPVPAESPGTLMARRGVFTDVGSFHEDLQLAYFADWYGRALDAGKKSAVLEDTILWRRIHENNHGIRDRALFASEHARVLSERLARRRSSGKASS